MSFLFFFYLLVSRTPKSTLFPYTTLFRSLYPDRRSEIGAQIEQVVLDTREHLAEAAGAKRGARDADRAIGLDRKSTRLNSSHGYISYAVFCLKKKKKLNKPSLQY